MSCLSQAILFLVLLISFGSLHAGLVYQGSHTVGKFAVQDLIQDHTKKCPVQFKKLNFDTSSGGLAALIKSDADIAGLDRYLTPEEKNMRFYYIIAGFDAVVVYLNTENPVKSLTREQIRGIFTGKIRNWNELGWKNLPIKPILESEKNQSGILQYFIENVMMGSLVSHASRVSDPVLALQKVGNDPGAVTMGSGGNIASSGLRVASVDGIDPTYKNIKSGGYPFTIPVIFASRKAPEGDVRLFFDYILSQEGQKWLGYTFIPIRVKD